MLTPFFAAFARSASTTSTGRRITFVGSPGRLPIAVTVTAVSVTVTDTQDRRMGPARVVRAGTPTRNWPFRWGS